MKSLRVKSINYSGIDRLIVTDFDNCLIKTNDAVFSAGYNNKDFHFNKDISVAEKMKVYKEAELTEWGKELICLVRQGVKCMVTTSNLLSCDLIADILGISSNIICTNQTTNYKIDFLNSILIPFIYVDDISIVIKAVKNENGVLIQYKYGR